MSDEAAAQRKAQTRGLFNSVCADYDAGPGCFAHFGRKLVEAADLQPGQKILDIATGRGAVLLPAAERVGSRGEVLGIDLSEEMVRATAAEVARRGLAARVLVMDAEKLDAPEASFDRVLCGFGIMFFPDQGRALGEMRRVLKPGGRIALSTWRVSQSEEVTAAVAQLGLGGNPPGWITEPELLQQLLSRNGFSDIRVREDSQQFRYPGIEEYSQQARGTGLRRILDTLGDAQKQALSDALAERLRPHQRADGLYVEAVALIATGTRPAG